MLRVQDFSLVQSPPRFKSPTIDGRQSFTTDQFPLPTSLFVRDPSICPSISANQIKIHRGHPDQLHLMSTTSYLASLWSTQICHPLVECSKLRSSAANHIYHQIQHRPTQICRRSTHIYRGYSFVELCNLKPDFFNQL